MLEHAFATPQILGTESERRQKVARLRLRRFSEAQIAGQLGVSESTQSRSDVHSDASPRDVGILTRANPDRMYKTLCDGLVGRRSHTVAAAYGT